MPSYSAPDGRLAAVKRRLAVKYANLARVARSKPRRARFLRRSEKYAREAALLTPPGDQGDAQGD